MKTVASIIMFASFHAAFDISSINYIHFQQLVAALISRLAAIISAPIEWTCPPPGEGTLLPAIVMLLVVQFNKTFPSEAHTQFCKRHSVHHPPRPRRALSNFRFMCAICRETGKAFARLSNFPALRSHRANRTISCRETPYCRNRLRCSTAFVHLDCSVPVERSCSTGSADNRWQSEVGECKMVNRFWWPQWIGKQMNFEIMSHVLMALLRRFVPLSPPVQMLPSIVEVRWFLISFRVNQLYLFQLFLPCWNSQNKNLNKLER